MTNSEILAESDSPASPAVDPLAPDADAPYGYMIDLETGARRAKKRPGRQARGVQAPPFSTGGTPSLDALHERGEPIQTEPDRSPDAPRPRGKRARIRGRTHKPPPPPPPPFRAGPIATGMNKLYARAGRIVRAMDQDIGVAILATTRKESEDDTTVGEAWEELAKINPRIRGLLLRAIEGGAMQQLFMAHVPILLAIMMKERIRRHIPFMKLVASLLEPDDDGTPSDISEGLGGIAPDDVHQMMATAMAMMNEMTGEMPRSAGGAGAGPRDPGADMPVITTLPHSA